MFTCSADIASLWSTGTFTPELDGVAVFDASRLIATGQLYGRKADVPPYVGATGRGIGRGLRAWTEARARGIGQPSIGQTVPDANHPTRACPKASVSARSDRATRRRVIEDAFAEWPGRSPTSFDRWRALTIGREDFAPLNFLIAEQGGSVVGAELLLEDGEISVDKLAVRRELRDRGIAGALLATAFVRSFELGYATTGTSTDSRTGALTVYERVGMTMRERHTHYALDL